MSDHLVIKQCNKIKYAYPQKMLEITKIIIKKLDPRNGIKDWNFIPSYIKY